MTFFDANFVMAMQKLKRLEVGLAEVKKRTVKYDDGALKWESSDVDEVAVLMLRLLDEIAGPYKTA